MSPSFFLRFSLMITEITEYAGDGRRGTIQKEPVMPSKARWLSVLLLLAFACCMCWLRPQIPPWAFMWIAALAIFAECKWLTWRRARLFVESRSHDEKVQVPPTWIRAGYLLAWVGMDVTAFLR